MVWNAVLRALISPKDLPEFAKCTAKFIATCMRKIIRCQSDILTQKVGRIQRCPYRFRDGRIECECLECSDNRSEQKKYAMGADFLASLAYNHRTEKRRSNKEWQDQREDKEQKNHESNFEKSNNSSSKIFKNNRRSNITDVYFFTYILYMVFTFILHLIARFFLEIKPY